MDKDGFIPTWDEKASSLDAFEERVKRFVKCTKKTDRYLCANRILSRFDPERLPYKTITNAISEELLEQEDGSGALAIDQPFVRGLVQRQCRKL